MARIGSVHSSYRKTRDALKLAHRLLVAYPQARYGTHLIGIGNDEFEAEFTAMLDRLEDATVIDLWVVFERFIIDHVKANLPVAAHEASFGYQLREKIRAEIERWRFDDLLGLYKTSVTPARIGGAKQVKAYRDWVAHRNPRRLPSRRISPDRAYGMLAAIVRTIEAGKPGGSGPGS